MILLTISRITITQLPPLTVPLFDQEMQYLHDNGFKVLLLNQFAFDPTNNVLYLKNFPSFNGTRTNVVSASTTHSIPTAK